MKIEIPLKRANRIINHGPVVLVTCQLEEKNPNIITVAWATSVSQIPPLVVISIGETHHSHQLILESREFVINVPPCSLLPQVLKCGTLSGKNSNKFIDVGLKPLKAMHVRPPLIEECIGHLECQVTMHVKTGDHTLFVGSVKAAWVENTLFQDVWMTDSKGGAGLHHLGGNAFSVSKDRIIMKE